MYNGNTFTLFTQRESKKWIHAVLQAAGGAFGLTGFFLEVVKRYSDGKALFHIWHARFGSYIFFWKLSFS